MRILFVAAPLVGRLVPLLPLAAAARDAGHDVLLLSGGEALTVDTLGLPLQDVAADVAMGRTAMRLLFRHPGLARRGLAGRAGVEFAGLLFGEVNDAMLPAVTAQVCSWRPDLVVLESLAASGAVAAVAADVPAVLQESSLWDGSELLAATAAAMGGPVRTAATLTIAPPSVVGPRTGHPLRPAARAPDGELPEWLTAPRGRPRVLVSRSTTGGAQGGDAMPAVLAAAERVDAEFVLVRGPRRRSLPRNVRVTGWLPVAGALPHVDALVHHGGAGGLLEALAAGVPQLVVPGPGDRRYNAELLAARGAGLAAATRRITPAVLTRLVTDDDLRTAAREVAVEIAAMPDPAAVVPVLERAAR